MERARAAIHAEWVPDALSRSRWSAAHALKEIEEAYADLLEESISSGEPKLMEHDPSIFL